MFLGLVSPAVVAVVTVFTSKNKALINDFKKKLIGFYRIKPKYILIAVLIFAVIVAASICTSVLFGGSINQFSFTEDFSFSIGSTSAFLTILLVSCIEELRKCGRCRKRRDYLATYDGTIYANGTHTVIGTVLVRTSNKLTATQQKELEQKSH